MLSYAQDELLVLMVYIPVNIFFQSSWDDSCLPGFDHTKQWIK